MPNPDLYVGKEQTYVKHFVLEHYLERLAYNVFSFAEEFVYVDGFSGPWKSTNEKFDDTSFKIAVDRLKKVQSIYKGRGKNRKLKSFFIEQNKSAFEELNAAVKNMSDVTIEVVNGSFEDNIDKICKFVGNSFSLVFIDPTGWTGFDLNKITPLLNLRGEVLINFMTDFIVRFVDDPRPEITQSFDPLFGPNWYAEWKKLVDEGADHETAAVKLYISRIKKAGKFDYVSSTRILKPTSDRSYFHLIYATRHWKGILEFRGIEEKAIEAQEKIRNTAKYKAQVNRTGQDSLFGQQVMEIGPKNYQDEKDIQLRKGQNLLSQVLSQNPHGIKYEALAGKILEVPLVWEKDLKAWIEHLRENNKIQIPELTGKARVPQKGHTIIPIQP